MLHRRSASEYLEGTGVKVSKAKDGTYFATCPRNYTFSDVIEAVLTEASAEGMCQTGIAWEFVDEPGLTIAMAFTVTQKPIPTPSSEKGST